MSKKVSTVIQTNNLHPKQLKVFFTMITLYTFYFAANYNLGPATKFIQDAYDISNQEFGLLFTIFSLGFGLGQFAAGFLGDRYNPKHLMLIGAIGATVANFCFSLSSSMTAFAFFWGLNAVSLAMGWSPGCSILFRWIPRKRWGLFMGFFDAFAFLGGVIVYPIAGLSITYFGWRSAFIIPPILLGLWTIIFAIVVKSSPEHAGLTVEWKEPEDDASRVTLRDYGMVLKNPVINMICGVSLILVFIVGNSILQFKSGIFILTLLLFLAGGCIQGVQAPIFNLPGDILGSRLGGTGVGVVNGWSYIGASFAGGTLGLLMDSSGLTSGLLLMAGISLLGALIIWKVKE